MTNFDQKAFDVMKNDFPFFDHNPGVAYLDSAATSLTPRQVIDGICRYYEESSSNIHRGVYKASVEATDIYENTRKEILDFVNAPQKEFNVIYVRNTTEGMNLIARTLAAGSEALSKIYSSWSGGLQEGDVILISESEHHSNIVPWQMIAREKKLEVVYIPVNSHGELDHVAFEELKGKLANKRVRVVSLSKVSNVSGIIHDLTPMRDYAREKEALFIIDGAQAICHLPINVEELGCDFFVFSAHKMLGPTGIGAVVGKKELLNALPPFLGGGDMILDVHKDRTIYNEVPAKFEAGTPDIGGVYGFSEAIKYLKNAGLLEVHQYERELLFYAMGELAKEEIELHGPTLEEIQSGKVDKVGVISFGVPGVHPHDVGTIMDSAKVCIRVGHHCCQLLMEAWHVPATSRASFYLYNNRADVDQLIEGVRAVRKVFQR